MIRLSLHLELKGTGNQKYAQNQNFQKVDDSILVPSLLTIAQPRRGRGLGRSTTDLHSSELCGHLCTCRGRAIGLKHSWLADHRGQWGPKLLRRCRRREPVKRMKAGDYRVTSLLKPAEAPLCSGIHVHPELSDSFRHA